MIIDELIEYAVVKASSGTVKDVRAGLGYIGVMLDTGSCGLAYTFRNELGDCCGTLPEAGNLIGMEAAEVITWAKSGNRLRAAIGLAAINAVLNVPDADWETGNAIDALHISSSDTFGMVGEFKPFLPAIKSKTQNIYVFEQNVPEGSQLYTSSTIPLYLPKCDVVIITATSIINHTIDDIVSHCGNAREVCLVGPSMPICPGVLNRYHITLLAGSVVVNPERILQIISQGGGTKSMKPAVKQVLVRI